eukprot:gene7158-12815_t
MDLLGSILGKMDAPPMTAVDKEALKKAKEAKAKADKLKAKEKQKWSTFRTETEAQISEFVKDTNLKHKKFEAMDKVARSIVHDVAEVAGLTSFSFGEENVDRYLMIWKKEFAPSDAELEARRNGEEWDEEKEQQHAENLKKKNKDEVETEVSKKTRRKKQNSEPEKLLDKYAKIIGNDSGIKAARATTTNAAYGMGN